MQGRVGNLASDQRDTLEPTRGGLASYMERLENTNLCELVRFLCRGLHGPHTLVLECSILVQLKEIDFIASPHRFYFLIGISLIYEPNFCIPFTLASAE